MDGKLIGLVRDTVVKRYGAELWQSLAASGGGDPEADPSDALACWVGKEAVSTLHDTYPSLFDRHADLTAFIRGLGDDLPSVRGATPAEPVSLSLRYGAAPDGSLLVRIQAACSLCALIQGLIAGAAVHYGEPVLIHELKSRRRGDNVCVLQIEMRSRSSSDSMAVI